MTSEPESPNAGDPLSNDPRVSQYVGTAWDQLNRFHLLLTEHGVLRGLIGPQEPSRLWERHLLNSAAVVPFLSGTSSILDLGSGAGLPGVVVAAMLPSATVILLEPMERRCLWLTEVVEELGLKNVRVLRGRADEVTVSVGAVTARAVGSLDRLYGWAGPLLVDGGCLVALKGGRALDEVTESARAGSRAGFGGAEISEAVTIPGLESTRVVVAYKNGETRGAR